MDTKWAQDGEKVLGRKADWKRLGLFNVDTAAPSNPEQGEGHFHDTYQSLGLYDSALWHRVMQCRVVPKDDDYTINAYECDGRCFTNEGCSGLVTLTLPSCAANLIVDFLIQDANGIKVAPASGDNIRILAATSTTGCQSTTLSGFIRLVGINTTEWFGISKHSVKFALL